MQHLVSSKIQWVIDFATITHTVLLASLESSMNITFTALSWLRSFFTNSQQFIRISNCTPSIAALSQGVPLGSVLGPLLFSFLPPTRSPLHCYADDIQLYISTESVTNLANRVTEIKELMQANLQQNNNIIITSAKSFTKIPHNFCLTTDSSTLSPSYTSKKINCSVAAASVLHRII